MDTNNQESSSSSFRQFSDQLLRLQSTNFSNLSLNDSIWSINNKKQLPEERLNFDVSRAGKQPESDNNNNNSRISDDFNNLNVEGLVNDILNPGKEYQVNDLNSYRNDGWKIGSGFGSSGQKSDLNGGFNKGIYSKPWRNDHHFNSNNNINNNNNNIDVYGNGGGNFKGYYKNFNGRVAENESNGYGGSKGNRKNKETRKEGNKEVNGENKNSSVEKRFKSLPPSEALPRNEAIGGYIFVCNNDTMEENLRRQLFGLPPRYRDSVRAITPGLPLFLYNYSTHQLHGIYEAASFGGTNIDPTAWEDKKNHSESRFPAQVKVQTRRICEPLDEDAFRPILHHYDGPKFRLELSVPEALSLLDIFEDNHA